MALANDMTSFLNKFARRNGLLPLIPKLPKEYNMNAWADVVLEDTMVTFSRFFPHKIRFVVNEETCNKAIENKQTVWYIKDELLTGVKVLGAMDIDWKDCSADNVGLSQMGGYGYYTPNFGGFDATIEAFLGMQMAADNASLYNNNIYMDFVYPNKIILSSASNNSINLNSFVINLLVAHSSLATISPTKMEVFEDLASADIAKFLWTNLKYYDGLETIYVNIDLKLNELEQLASTREGIIDRLQESYVSAANDNIPYIITVSG